MLILNLEQEYKITMLRQIKKHILQPYFNLSLLLLSFFYSTAAIASTWDTLSPGIEYRSIIPNPITPWSKVHVFRIDLKHYELDIVTAKSLAKTHAPAEELAKSEDALIAVNGGFFDTKFTPLGLRIGHYEQLSAFKSISWWGVFYTKAERPHISKASKYKARAPKAEFAIQSGPRLLINGKSPSLKPGVAERTALGITKHHKVILLVTEHAPMSTPMLADMMKSYPLYCTEALNLDGGSSTQLYADVGHLKISSRTPLGVSDAVIVKPRK